MSGSRVLTAALLGVVLLTAGCGQETGPASAGLNGNFGGRLLGLNPDFAGMSLTESGGLISGSAWSGIAPALDRGARVTGSLAGNRVTLRLVGPVGQPEWFFNGTWASDTLRGELALVVGAGFPVELVRIDTIPSGNGTIVVRGAETGDGSGKALFGYDQQGMPLLGIETSAPFTAQLIVSWPGRDRPKVGQASLGAPGSPVVTLIRDGETFYAASSGLVRIELFEPVHSDRSDRYHCEEPCRWNRHGVQSFQCRVCVRVLLASFFSGSPPRVSR